MWGDPADKSHDRYRGDCVGQGIGANGAICPLSAPEKAFLRLPTSCSGAGMPFAIDSNSYEHTERFIAASATGPAMSGCERVPFNPNIEVVPTVTAANSPTGVAVTLSVPQSSNPAAVAEADMKKAVVTLPEGMAIDPSSADGLQACTGRAAEDRPGRRLGMPGRLEDRDAGAASPLVANPIDGFIWLRPQNSSDPASGEMFRIALELRDDLHGIDIAAGQVAANPVKGRLTTTFDENPQLPFENIRSASNPGRARRW